MEELRRLNEAVDWWRHDPSLSLSLVADRVGLSVSYLGDLFKRQIGETPGKFRKRQQLRPLLRELRYRDEAITDLWMETDFTSPSDLTRSVTRAFGYSPTDIQKGAWPCLNESRRQRSSRCSRFSTGLRPAGYREPRILELGPLRLAYKRTFLPMTGGDPLRDVVDMFHWALSKNIPLFSPWGLVGLCHDDFDLDPFDHFVYEAAIVLPEWFREPLPPWMSLYRQPAGAYAAFPFEGDLEGEEDAIDFFYRGWLPRSGYRLDRRAGLEIFLSESSVTDWNHLKLELLFPIKKGA